MYISITKICAKCEAFSCSRYISAVLPPACESTTIERGNAKTLSPVENRLSCKIPIHRKCPMQRERLHFALVYAPKRQLSWHRRASHLHSASRPPASSAPPPAPPSSPRAPASCAAPACRRRGCAASCPSRPCACASPYPGAVDVVSRSSSSSSRSSSKSRRSSSSSSIVRTLCLCLPSAFSLARRSFLTAYRGIYLRINGRDLLKESTAGILMYLLGVVLFLLLLLVKHLAGCVNVRMKQRR